MLNGPDGMGGAINLVTRKPVKPFEAEVRASALLAGQGESNGNTVYAHIGSRQQNWYYQASVQQRDINHWRLSRDFNPPGPFNPGNADAVAAAEDGGKRRNSGKKDWRVGLKAGYTPNATDEYSLNFVKQSGEKSGLQSAAGRGQPWEWPTWDTWSAYWLSHTQLGESSYLKTRLYYSKFDNTLHLGFLQSNNPCYWAAGGCLSYYDDNAHGASIEVGTAHFDNHTVKMALHYRRDEHTEWERVVGTGFTEPKHSTLESTYSIALEDTWRITPRLELIAGISRDMRRSHKVEEFRSQDTPSFFRRPVADSFATNYQGALNYRYSAAGKAHLAVSDRTRFPNQFERFSGQMGAATSNPWLQPERARNIEIGVSDMLTSSVRIDAALFHNAVRDAIVGVQVPNPIAPGSTVTQRQNVGKATYRGFEAGLTAFVTPALGVGGNYTYIDTKLKNPADPSMRLTTTPRHKAFAYAKWQPSDALRVIPSIEHTSARWSNVDGVASQYTKTDDFTLLNFKVEYTLAPGWDISLAARNLLDKNYQVVDGFPQEGRNFILATRYQF